MELNPQTKKSILFWQLHFGIQVGKHVVSVCILSTFRILAFYPRSGYQPSISLKLFKNFNHVNTYDCV